MKRRISLLLALVIVLGSFGTAFAAVPTTAEGKADFLKEQEILQGNTKGDLMLDMKENRQNMVVMLSRLMKQADEAKDYKGNEAAKFEDVTDKVYKPYVAWGVANNYIIGQSETKFGAKDNVKAIDYSLVLLRALGHLSGSNAEAEYTVSFQMAKDLGLLEGLELEAKDELTREQMSVMIYNALGTNMKGSEKTLAEFLEIKMPVEEVTELKVDVRTENLKEVIVELNKELKGEDLKLVDNYRIVGNKINEVKVEGKVITLSLNEELVSGRKYDLVVRNLSRDNKELIGTHPFVARDNEAPVALSAKFLGENGIKVTFSEPIAVARERNFRLVDNKNAVMKVNNFGREIVLVPYGKEKFDMDKYTELKVVEVIDHAGIKSNLKTLEIAKADENYKDAPEVASVKAFENKLRVRFDKEIYEPSLAAGSKGNVEYLVRGKHAAYPTTFKMLDAYTVEYTFGRALSDRHTEVKISGVKNHSDVEMKAVTEQIEVIYDRSEPVVINTDNIIGKPVNGKVDVKVVLTFDKDITTIKASDLDKEGNVKKDQLGTYFELFEVELKNLSKQVRAQKHIDLANVSENKVTVVLEGLNVKNNYILETDRLVDTTVLGNRMYREYTLVELGTPAAGKTLKVVDFEVIKKNKDGNRVEELRITFDKKLDRLAAEDPANYILKHNLGETRTVDKIAGFEAIELDSNGKTVNIMFNDIVLGSYDEIQITKGVIGLDEEILAKEVAIKLSDLAEEFIKRLDKAVADAEKLGIKEDDVAELAKLTGENALDRTQANHDKLLEAVKEVEKAIEKKEKENADENKDVKEALEALIEEAEAANKDLEDADLTGAIATAKEELKNAKTEKDYKAATEKLQAALDKAKAEKEVEEYVEKLGEIKKLEDKDLKTEEAIKEAKKQLIDDEALVKKAEAANKDLKDKDLTKAITKANEVIEYNQKAITKAEAK